MLLILQSTLPDLSPIPEIDRDVERTHVGPTEPVSSAIRAALAEGVQWLQVNDRKARAGFDVGVHHLRTTTRRLRTVLDLFQDLTDAAWNDQLADDLKWLAAQLGEVRDIDVLKARFLREAKAIDSVEPLAPLFEGLDALHRVASEELRAVLDGTRYQTLTGRLDEAIENLPLTEAAVEPCRKVLPRLVQVAWKSLRKEARALDPGDPDERFHDVRKRAKRARYAAEAVKDSLDHDTRHAAQGFARKARLVQDVLGEHQDAVVAADFLRQAAEQHADLGRFGFAAGRLMEQELRAALESRNRFFDVFPEIDRKKVVRWLQS